MISISLKDALLYRYEQETGGNATRGNVVVDEVFEFAENRIQELEARTHMLEEHIDNLQFLLNQRNAEIDALKSREGWISLKDESGSFCVFAGKGESNEKTK